MNVRSWLEAFVAIILFSNVACQPEHSYDQNLILRQLAQDDIHPDSLLDIQKQYQSELIQIKKEYPLIYHRILLSDMAYAELMIQKLPDIQAHPKKLACLLYAMTQSEYYRRLCDGVTFPPIASCGKPSDYFKIKPGLDGTIVEGCDIDCAHESWSECMRKNH